MPSLNLEEKDFRSGSRQDTFEETEGGGRVRIVTKDEVALKAIYDFLRYQIKQRATGDSLVVRHDCGRARAWYC